MKAESPESRCYRYLNKLCCEIPERSVGSEGNRMAVSFFEKEVSQFGWETIEQSFQAMDWQHEGASLKAGDMDFYVQVSPYSLGCHIKAELTAASSIEELERLDAKGKIILLHGELAKEQLMPKNFIFYNPEEHQKIISLLENSQALALITATGRNSALAGGAYPFPLIEDGDFNTPSVYMTDVEGEKLLKYNGRTVSLSSVSKRIEGKGANIVARKGKDTSSRIVVSAHIDAKKGTPGAIDNATGVAVLMLLAESLKDYQKIRQIELVPFNGEDYYAVSGQMKYISENKDRFQEITLNINIDGLGYHEGDTAFSFYNLPDSTKEKAQSVLREFPGVTEGPQWPQGDHSIFVQFGRPAIALTSKWFTDNMEVQQITHTPKDNLGIVDVKKVVRAAEAIKKLLLEI